MKIRSGFVSNSSSSSFIMVGVEVSDPEKYHDPESDKEQELDNVPETNIVGEYVGRSYDDCGIEAVSIESIIKSAEAVRKIVGPDVDIKLYYGQEIC